MFPHVKRKYFTLLEILVVLFITSFGIVLAGIKIVDLYQEQRFLSEVEQIRSHLAMAQELMLIMDTDVVVKFSSDSTQHAINVWLEIEKPLEKGWARLVERKLTLSAIESITFSGREEHDLTLFFTLGKMSQGTLILNREKNSKVDEMPQIELTGYPRPLTTTKSEKKEKSEENLYPAEVYKKLYEDPNQKNQPH